MTHMKTFSKYKRTGVELIDYKMTKKNEDMLKIQKEKSTNSTGADGVQTKMFKIKNYTK
jgi:hypothetical protein